MYNSFKIADGLFLIRHAGAAAAASAPVTVPVQTNHIVVIDCSGSMSYDLPRIRAQLKNKLPKLIAEGDTLSIIWFSGKGQYGALIEGEKLTGLADLSTVQKAIDRWLQPQGLTGFKEPLEETAALITRVAKNNKNGVFSLFFMSDGCDNQWSRGDILKAVEKAAGGLASSTFVEYGYYADRNLLSAMTQKAGGVHIFAEDFDRFMPQFEAVMQKRATSSKKVEVATPGDVIGGIAFALTDGEIMTFESNGGKVLLPEAMKGEIAYLSSVPVDKNAMFDLQRLVHDYAKGKPGARDADSTAAVSAAYAALSLFAVRMKPEIVFPLLKTLGDVYFINMFASCFGKQKYSEFMDATKAAAFSSKLQMIGGYDPARVPPDDAFTVLDLIGTLAADDDTRIFIDSPHFKYSRISRGRVDADENLSAAEQEEVDEITAKMSGEKNAKKLKELQAQIDVITSKKRDALVFERDAAPDGYSISGLTYNEARPNISVLVRKTGKVDLTARKASAKAPGTVPDVMPSHIFRNYALVRDGLVNVEELPVRITSAMMTKLTELGVKMRDFGTPSNGIEVIIDLKALPIINRKMVKTVSATRLFELEFELTKQRAAQKVYKAYEKEMFPKTAGANFEQTYGADGAAWLKDQGITESNGFAPKMVQAESKDFYVGKELSVSLKGFATLPSVKDVKERMAKAGTKPLTGCAALMADVITECEGAFKKLPASKHEQWIKDKVKHTVATVRGLLHQKAQTQFAIIVGQTWFSEFKSLDENTLTLKLGGEDVIGKVEQNEVEIHI